MPKWDLKKSSVRIKTFEERKGTEGKTKYGLRIAGYESSTYPGEFGGDYSGPAEIHEEDIETLKKIITKYETYRDSAREAESI